MEEGDGGEGGEGGREADRERKHTRVSLVCRILLEYVVDWDATIKPNQGSLSIDIC